MGFKYRKTDLFKLYTIFVGLSFEIFFVEKITISTTAVLCGSITFL